MKKGLFIALEGVAGCGKTTQVNRLHDYIKSLSKDTDVLTTHEPWKGREVKKMLKSDADPYSNMLEITRLLVEDRENHLMSLIRPVIYNEGTVISDRYNMSTYAYQMTQGVDFEFIDALHISKGIAPPDITFYLDVGLDCVVDRLDQRKIKGESVEKFERVDFLEKLIGTYRRLVEENMEDKSRFGEIIVINGEADVESVSREIISSFNGNAKMLALEV